MSPRSMSAACRPDNASFSPGNGGTPALGITRTMRSRYRCPWTRERRRNGRGSRSKVSLRNKLPACEKYRDGYLQQRDKVTPHECLSIALALRLPLAALADSDIFRRAHGGEPSQATSEPGSGAAADDCDHRRRARQHSGEADST